MPPESQDGVLSTLSPAAAKAAASKVATPGAAPASASASGHHGSSAAAAAAAAASAAMHKLLATAAPKSVLSLPPPVGSVLDLVGNTPILKVSDKFDTGCCELFLKLESQNPGGSIKDRIALSMVAAAEAEGRLRTGGRIFEATAGNTGLALALVAARRGYRLTVVVPDKMSDEKIASLRGMGAEVVLTRSDVVKGHPDYYQDLAARLAREAEAATGEPVLYIDQFNNPANPAAHFAGTGPEIWAQLGGRVDAFVAGVGSGGTLAGAGAFLKSVNPNVDLVLADPVGSVLAPLVESGSCGKAGSWLVEGIGEDFVPSVLDLSLVTRAYSITDAEAFAAARELLRSEGVLAGGSAGALLAAALKYCREQTVPKRVVTIVCDSGARYLSKQFNDFWMREQGLHPRPATGDVRDLIARRHLEGEDVWVTPELPVDQAIRRMRAHGISQMAVLAEPDGADAPAVDGGSANGGAAGGAAPAAAGGVEAARVVGIIDESDLLLALLRDGPGATARPVSRYMEPRVETVAPTAAPAELLPVLRAGRVAVVAGPGGAPFYGLITNIDLINYLRARVD
ncbi:cystathionine beta-synthase [Raphidocelis subcapitata]|uniref:cystathionine beta-synthase n=1 Tax=Raphidocelis subcapitata TaxID=307507 RepID=A0A2V0NTM5_9CHLO|nr:cystathionine beta-synthase [Raphidocelis subcapitata]|eukprot:GBF88277.1 cystathionine beta-synthase [Raphidocelis subcapitata]